VELFLAAMVWGFGIDEPRFPVQKNMLIGRATAAMRHRASLTAIVNDTQIHGAAAGWSTAASRSALVVGVSTVLATTTVAKTMEPSFAREPEGRGLWCDPP
jgi:hypothetical protein